LIHFYKRLKNGGEYDGKSSFGDRPED